MQLKNHHTNIVNQTLAAVRQTQYEANEKQEGKDEGYIHQADQQLGTPLLF